MAVTGRVIKDRRAFSHIPTKFNCQFEHEGICREAVLFNISMNGAFLASKHMPPIGSSLTVSLKPPGINNVIKIEGAVVRGGWEFSEYGSIGKFGVRFFRTSPELMAIIAKLR